MALALLFDIGILIIVSAALAYIARALKQPIIIAYVVAGLIIGPMGLGIITNPEEISLMSELGIIFLLFSVGLEIDFRKFKSVGFISFVGGALQVTLMFILGFLTALFFGLGMLMGIYLGLLLALSSTMIATKLLVDKDEINTLHGRIMLGILLFQDIIAVVAIPVLKNMYSVFSFEFFGSIIFRGLGLFAIAILLNKFFFPKILDYAAERHEMLFITAIANCFFFIGASYVLGFSVTIGGFIAGLSMANFPYNVEIAGEIHSLRDFFLIIFFSTLGMQLNFFVIEAMFPMFVTLLLLTVFLKPIILGVMYLLSGYGGRTSTYIGLGLGQASEFMFIIAAEEFMLGHISHDFYSLLISIVVVSMITTPYLATIRNSVYNLFAKIKLPKRHIFHPRSIHEIENPPVEEVSEHIVIFGAHRMGEKIVQHLKDMDESFIVVERDPEIVKELGKRGIYCVYGDAENEDILKKVSVSKAKLIIITIPYADISSFVIRKAKRTNPKIKILARAHSEIDAERLYRAGADIVIIPEFVSAERMIKKLNYFLKGNKLCA
ncbi:MAG: cation:proton antiporter [Candidatus Aenigmarchaeota archaeon]|nr:cation:proton antiporter [Candidatus Aenigmarchaeota archaeon]